MLKIILSPAKKMVVDSDSLETVSLPPFLDKTEIIKNNNILFEQDISFFEDLVFNSTYFCKCKKISFIDFIGNHYIQRNLKVLHLLQI